MKIPQKGKAANVQNAFRHSTDESAQDQKGGHGAKDTRNGMLYATGIGMPRAMIGVPHQQTGRSLGGLQNVRRMIAAPRFYVRGVFIGGVRIHGRSVSARFMTGAPSGKPLGLPLPNERSANLLGAAHPLAGVKRSQNINVRRPCNEFA